VCLAAPGRIIAIEANQAVVDLDGRVRRASLERMPQIAVGDWALVAAGSVVRRLDPDEAAEIRDLLAWSGRNPPDTRSLPGGPP
jgi:hydrogenase expression/formation protein HypC